MPNSIVCSELGHSRAWWAPISKKTGLPSLMLSAPVVISRPRIFSPSTVRLASVSGRVSRG